MSEFDFQPYLSAIARHYGQQRHLYTLTDALLPLEARSVEREEDDREQRVEEFPVLAGLRKYALGDEREHVLLAGRPGSGKSTALWQLVVELAADGLVPVLVQLKGDRTVPELIQAEFRRMKQRVALEQIEDWLLADRLVLLLDGVNEIPNDDLRRSLAQFREDNLSVPMIFTTRDLSLGGDLGIGKRLEMKPLSEPQLREFVGKYLPEQGEKLLGQLRDRLREIAETPLLLKMLCDVFGQTGEIPANKGELFRLFDRKYEKFKESSAVSADSRRFKSEILQRLAFVMMQGDESNPTEFWLTIERSQAERSIEQWLTNRVSDPGVRAKEWLEDLLEHHLLQVAADGRRVEFHHQLFQEYYAAEWLLGMFADRHPDVVEPERFQHFYLNYLKWTESVAIVLSLMEDEETAVDLVQQALGVDLMLGARLAGEVRSTLQPQTVGLVERLEIPDHLRIKLLGDTKTLIATSLLVDFLSHPDISLAKTAAFGIGSTSNQKTIDTLTERLQALDQKFFAQGTYGGSDKTGVIWTDHVQALAYISPKKATDFLKSKLLPTGGFNTIISLFTRGSQILMQLSPEEIAPQLINLLMQSSSQAEIDKHGVLNLIGKSEKQCEAFLPELIDILKREEHEGVQEILADLITQFKSELTIRTSMWMMYHPNEKVRKKAIAFIVKHKIYSLREDLNHLFGQIDDYPYQAFSSAIALAGLACDESIDFLGKILLNHEFYGARAYAANALKDLNNQKSASFLIQGLQDSHENVRCESAFSLAIMGREEAIPVLEMYLRIGIRENYIRALRSFACFNLKASLWKNLNNNKFGWQTAAVELVKLGEKAAVPHLCKVLVDLGEESSSEVINLLANSADENTVDWLINALKNSQQYQTDQYFLNRVALTLNRLQNHLAEISLSQLLKLLPDCYFEHLSWLIPYTQSQCKFYNYEIFHSPPAKPQPTQQDTLDTIATTVVETNERIKQMAEQPSIQIGSISGGINNFTPNQGTQNLTHIETQNNYATDPNLLQTIQNLLQQNTDLHNFITELETQSPQTEAEAEAARDQAITRLQSTNPTRWNTIRHQMRTLKRQLLNPERHAQAAKATLVEVTKAYWEKSLIAKAIITYIDKLSETPDQGA
jgi:HEAT repeat protein